MPIISSKGGLSSGGYGQFAYAASTAPTNSYFPIASYTVPSGGVSSITFGGLSQTYSHLQIRATFKETFNTGTSVDNLNIRFNEDTTASYIRHALWGTGALAYAEGYTGQTLGAIAITPRNTSGSTYGAMVLDILDYANTNKRKTLRCLNGVDLNGAGEIRLSSVLWNKTDAITSITFTGDSSGFQEFTNFSIYGVN